MRQFTIIGHVNTGKFSLGGRLLVDTGAVDWDQKKPLASFFDIYEEEQNKSNPQEWSLYDFEYNRHHYRIINTPEHKIYIRSMIEAISKNPTNTAIVVLSAGSNEFDSSFKNGQTKEDLLLTRATGHDYLIVAINKIDALNNHEINDKIKHIQQKIELYTKQLKFKRVVLCPVSAITGQGISYLLHSIEKTCENSEKDENNQEQNIKEPIQTNTVKAEFAYMRPDLLLSGIISNAYIDGKEYTVELIFRERFIKKQGKYIITVRFLDGVVNNIYRRQKIILCRENNILGFGEISDKCSGY